MAGLRLYGIMRYDTVCIMTFATIFDYFILTRKEWGYGLEGNECHGRADQVYSSGFECGF
jgi:hypothetical protein